MKIFKWFGGVKKSLTTIGNKEPLNFFSIMLLIALDIFVIMNIFSGLNTQVSQLTRPTEKVPYQCSQVINSLDKNNNIQFRDVERWADKGENHFYQNVNYRIDSYNKINEINNNKIVDECKTIYAAIIKVESDVEIDKKLREIANLEKTVYSNQDWIRQKEREYNTNLLEKIAGQEEAYSITGSSAEKVKSEIKSLESQNLQLNRQIASLENQILNLNSVQNAKGKIIENKQAIESKLKSENFWYPLKVYLVKMIFVIPLFLLFWFLYKRASRKESSISSLIYAHLLVISTIPIILGIFEMIFKILPYRYFEQFLSFLVALNIGGVLNYLLILIGVFVTMFIIYIVQKKIFNKQKVRMKRINKGKCPYCSYKVYKNDIHCYSCGEEQKVKCIKCNYFTHKEGKYCSICGTSEFKA